MPLGRFGAQEVSFYSFVPIAKSFGIDVTETLTVAEEMRVSHERLFARRNQWLTPSPNSNRLC